MGQGKNTKVSKEFKKTKQSFKSVMHLLVEWWKMMEVMVLAEGWGGACHRTIIITTNYSR